MYFFQRWYLDLNHTAQALVQDLVRSNRLEFVGGGLVQHDEALPSLDMMIRQTEHGLDFLHSHFNISHLPVAWQIDPFGHSAVSPPLFRKFGFQYFVGNRINYKVKNELKRQKALEFLWNGSKLGSESSIFTHILPESYGFPSDLNPYLPTSCWSTSPSKW